MLIRNSFPTVVTLLVTALACAPSEKNASVLTDDIPICGTVQFSDGCSDELDPMIAYGLALIHHMTYEEADKVFTKVSEADETCFWGPWGKALSVIHPLWNDPPSEERFKAGADLSQAAMKLATTEKEMAYGRTLAAYYEGGLQTPERERLKNFHGAWELAFNANQDDLEAKAFYALSMIAVADPTDKTFASQLKAGALAEEVLLEIQDHPGAFHYIIHAYDYPGLSSKAIQVANTYGTIAPEIPHALHMPSHIFTRLGMWKESIEWNTRSAAAAMKNPVGGAISMHYFHAMDYMMYSHLQRGEVTKARAVLEEMKGRSGPFHAHNATAYALAAGEGRFHLERMDWKSASMMSLPASGEFPWEKFPDSRALNAFAIGLGAARSGPVERAEMAMKSLDSLKPSIKHPYFLGQVDVQKNIIKAWLALGKGKKKDAVELMRQACDLEWATEKHPITPGELLPSRELFGDMLVETNSPKEALEQYEMSLRRSPNRLNSLYGAARAAELSGDHEKAKEYYTKVVELTSDSGDILERRQSAMEKLSSL
ncbi:MAG: tetratricopeptide repeat protein [Cyclobacteriaceae bacterium]